MIAKAFTSSILLSEKLLELHFDNVSSCEGAVISLLKARLSPCNANRLKLFSLSNGSISDLDDKQWILAHSRDLARVGCVIVMELEEDLY
ncbi:hypothetical protein BT69DRAFT_1278410 [Atractiella rhizophila]|nr:hypothetical protein BT69DRAFT_1278410 [Atractiella rhizophila]